MWIYSQVRLLQTCSSGARDQVKRHGRSPLKKSWRQLLHDLKTTQIMVDIAATVVFSSLSPAGRHVDRLLRRLSKEYRSAVSSTDYVWHFSRDGEDHGIGSWDLEVLAA